MSAQVRFPSDPGLEDLLRVTGEVTGIDPSADPPTRRGAVEIALYGRAPGARAANGSDQSGPRLPAGFFAQASIEVERLPDAIWIARRHVHWSEGKPVAFVVEGAGDQERAAERELVLVREHGEGFLVRSGLAAGDVLITHPLDRMRSGAVVASTRDRVP